MTSIEVAASLARRFEGCRLSPYLDSVGVPTIGYGATFYENGERVTLHDERITKERAEELLNWHLSHVFAPQVSKLCPSAKGDRLAALIDFAFNLGVGRLKNSTLRKKVNAGLWDETPREFRKWSMAGGIKLRGLVARREAEIALI